MISLQVVQQEYRQKREKLYAETRVIQEQTDELRNQKYRMENELNEIRRKDIFEYQEKKE